MSMEYSTEPKIEYDDFVRRLIRVTLLSPGVEKYTTPHKLMQLGENFECDGMVMFESFGRENGTEMFALIKEQFGVKILNEYGVEQ